MNDTAAATEPVVTTYVEYLSRNVIVADVSHREVPRRDPAAAAREASPGVYAFRFYDELSTDWDGSPLRSGPLRESAWYWIDAERLTAADVEALPGDHRILLDNMRCNGWAAVARGRAGNFQPMGDRDMIISSETGATS